MLEQELRMGLRAPDWAGPQWLAAVPAGPPSEFTEFIELKAKLQYAKIIPVIYYNSRRLVHGHFLTFLTV